MSFITLIPKIDDPTFVKDLCLVSLIRLKYKIILKLLESHLMQVTSDLLSDEQSTLAIWRHILGGSLMVHQIFT